MINLKHIVHTDIEGEPKSDQHWWGRGGSAKNLQKEMRPSAKKWPKIIEGEEVRQKVTNSDGGRGGLAIKWPKVMEGGQLKGDGEGGWPMQLAKCDAIFMDFIWPSSNEINSSPPFLKVLWGPQVFRLVSGTTILAPFNAFWDIFEVAREGNVAQNTPKMTKFCF